MCAKVGASRMSQLFRLQFVKDGRTNSRILHQDTIPFNSSPCSSVKTPEENLENTIHFRCDILDTIHFFLNEKE